MNRPSARRQLYSIGMFLLVSVLAGLLTSGLAVPVAALVGYSTKLAADSIQYLPSELETPPQSEGSQVLMADGSVLAEFFEENREYKPLGEINPVMQNAQIAIEDHRFYEHGAIDIQGLGRAVFKTLTGNQQGASTLTQQYVKLVQVDAANRRGDAAAAQAAQAPTIERKIREMRYAMAIEKRLSKTDILERYLNIAYYGDGAYGVEAAAQHYWNTNAASLTLDQSAMLAGIVQNPVAYNPVKHPKRAIERRNHVLTRMAQLGMVTKEEADAAKQVGFDPSVIKSSPNGCHSSRFPIMCDYVRRTLLSDKMGSMGSTPEERERTLKRGGLTIQTHINPKAQAAAEEAVAGIVGPTDPVWGGTTLIQPSTGLIVAMAQSRPKLGDEPGQTYYNVSVEKSMGGIEGFQAGSTFKPFVIATALEQGYSPTKTIIDSPAQLNAKGMKFRSCEGTFSAGKWEPKNYDTGYGPIDMYKAAQSSVNTYFIQLEQKVGICESIKMAQRLGVKLSNGTDMRVEAVNPSWVLGTSDITPLSMAEAYATFANRGVHCDPIILQSVVNKAGENFEVPSGNCQQVVDPAIADGVTHVLQSVMSDGTGKAARMSNGVPQAGKTGTTNDAKAVWFAGYTPQMAGVAYIGVDKVAEYWEGRGKTLDGLVTSAGVELRGTGGGDAGKIWKTAMAAAIEGLEPGEFAKPAPKVLEGEKVEVPSVAGMGYEEAKATLEAAGFSTSKANVYSSSPAGNYLGRISPTGQAPRGSTIQMLFSKGPQPAPQPSVQVPNPQPTLIVPPPPTENP